MPFWENHTFFADVYLPHHLAVFEVGIGGGAVVFAGELDYLAAAAPAVWRIVLSATINTRL